jgi:hypothetical protein
LKAYTRIALSVLAVVLAAGSAAADERVAPVSDPLVRKECGGCHMVFPPQFLPRRSWQRIVDTLSDHFGENASLPPAQRKAVLDALLALAADGPGGGREGRKFAASIPAGQTPLRITETGRWLGEHRKVPADRWKSAEVKSRANCVACHKAAEQGLFED